MHTTEAPNLRRWAREQRRADLDESLASPLLDLHRSSDVNDIGRDHLSLVRDAISARSSIPTGMAPTSTRPGTDQSALTSDLQRLVVESFLKGRRERFGNDQSQPLRDFKAMAAEGRDTFIVIKFMDEAPHLRATLSSLVEQTIDLRRVVILAVDNNSTDGSAEIARQFADDHSTSARVLYLNQQVPGAGNAARLGVDTCIATIHAMCSYDNQWDRLQTATVAVSDGDTVYHPEAVQGAREQLDADPDVDAVMPFLIYKLTAALRLLTRHVPADVEHLRCSSDAATRVPVPLDGTDAHAAFPRDARIVTPEGVHLETRDGRVIEAPFTVVDPHGRRVAALEDSAGRRAWVFDDRRLILDAAPVSGYDSALVALENGEVGEEEIWKWHTVVGHDLFLWWAYVGMGLDERLVFPDTSDALKTVRTWALAIGGQHQLQRPGLQIATGSDYQSGRVLQMAGCRVVLGDPQAPAETEVDRLIKMIRNFVNDQAVFYGDTRSEMLDRATGLYVHMTRIQRALEAEVRAYPDTVFREIAFPERVLFPLRWMVQNAVRYAAQGPLEAERSHRRFFDHMMPSGAPWLSSTVLTPARLSEIAEAPLHRKQELAEEVAEEIINSNHRELMEFYVRTLRSFFRAHGLDPDHYRWLIEPVLGARNALDEEPPLVDPLAVWSATDFDIDQARGQVTSLRSGA